MSSEVFTELLKKNKTSLLSEIINENDIILMQGGGNFGDLWRDERENRNAMLALFPKNQVVFLPQTINYLNLNGKALKEDQSKLSFKTNLVITVRSEDSLFFAMINFRQTKALLVPDAAFMLGNIEINSQHILYDVLILRRTDKESNFKSTQWYKAYKAEFTFKYSYLDVDWYSYNESQIANTYHTSSNITGAMSYLNELAEERRLLINKIMSQAKIVVTDRLHASIYSLLIGKPHIIVHDKYKKIFNARETAFRNKPECSAQNLNEHYAKNPKEAFKLAVKLLDLSV